MTSPIQNACDVPLTANPGTLPNMQGAMANWFQPLVFTRVVKETVGFELVETTTPFQFQGVRAPMPEQKLQMKPEGQRHWLWEVVYAYPGLVLTVDEKVQFNGVTYRVMGRWNYAEYGFLEYHIVQDYQEAQSCRLPSFPFASRS